MAGEREAALARLMSHEARVRSFFLRHVDEYEADDLTQDTLFAAWRALPDFRGDSAMGTWIQGIAKRRLWNHYRHNASRPLVLDLDGELEAGLSFRAFAASPDNDRVSGLALEMALEGLCSADRQLYESFYRHRICVRHIARDTGEPEGTVKYRLFRLRNNLRRFFT